MTADERRLVERVLEILGPAGAAYRDQLATARAKASCTCGCPSFSIVPGSGAVADAADLSHDDETPTSRLLADGFAKMRDGHDVDVILFQRGGLLHELEVLVSSGGPYALPDPESFRPWGATPPFE